MSSFTWHSGKGEPMGTETRAVFPGIPGVLHEGVWGTSLVLLRSLHMCYYSKNCTPNIVYYVIHKFENKNIHWETKRAPICGSTPRMPTKARAGPGQRWWWGTQSGAPTWVAGTQFHEPPPAASQVTRWHAAGVRSHSQVRDPGTAL